MLYELREKVISLFADYSAVVFEGKHTSIYRKGLEILASK